MTQNIESITPLAETYPYIPISISFEIKNLNIFKLTQICDRLGDCFQLTIADHKKEKYSYFALEPQASITVLDGSISVQAGHNEQIIKQDPHTYIEKLLLKHQQPKIQGLPPFTGGLVGYFSYEYTKYYLRKITFNHPNPDNLKDAGLLLCNFVIAYRHSDHRLFLIQSIASQNLHKNYMQADKKLHLIKQKILALLNQELEKPTLVQLSPFKLQHSIKDFSTGIAKAQSHIKNGDIFQLIYSNPHSCHAKGSLIPVAQQLAQSDPSPYNFYFHQNNFQIAGASPETLVTKFSEQLVTYPLAGTRRRGKTPAEDEKFAHELQNDPKELSEHNMLVDLGRNDLGQVSQFGSVHVTAHAQLERYSKIMHLASTIKSVAASDKSVLDILEAVFPAGTLSGAPKIRAIQLIDELERTKRGVYGGCFGYLCFNGDMDVCIGIRMVHKTSDKAVIHTGAGIVADSIPKHEYQECLNKARAVDLAFNKVTGGKNNGTLN
ncbi:anthranilate synthase component I family protein [Liquorilactobacillus uvarum]|uniref:anthranilate synthase component I family protein n=1 Tax=Liquorilactobacillus uvarum TaxID=303240 RepID=UPI0028897AC6|nr:chorismate-binding protein [Liquorilactobacillus uvarum]